MVAGPPLSVAEASRLSGISRPAIDKHVRAGRLQIASEGGIDRTSFDAWLADRLGNGVVPKKGKSDAHPAPKQPATVGTDGVAAENAARALAALSKAGGVFDSKAEAERHRDSYIAHLRRIEFERERGSLIETEKVAAAMEADYSRVRTRLLAIPAEQSPRLHRLKTVAEVQDALQEIITEALEELSRGIAQQLG